MHKGDLYVHMFWEAGVDPLDIPAPQTFLYIWQTTYLQLKIPRNNTLGICDTCCNLKESMHSLLCHSKRGEIYRVHSRNIYLKFKWKNMSN
jgi:hypothetical protein